MAADRHASTRFANHFLIAMPNMADENFGGALVLVAEHSDRGALGLVVNRPTDITMGTLFERIDLSLAGQPLADEPVLFGGPVQSDRGFVLHQPVGGWSSSVTVGDGLALTSSKDVLEAVARGEGPDRLLVTLGYAGWGPGQLEQEIGQNAWLTVPASADLLFEVPLDQRFERAFRKLGIDPLLLSPAAGHA
jgi:putative transcriptional regulator